ncbi:MAG: hypothetical protein IJW97_00205 [Clostridia bacterium]|nr:hypothetical protein [Clostridia bacterium]
MYHKIGIPRVLLILLLITLLLPLYACAEDEYSGESIPVLSTTFPDMKSMTAAPLEDVPYQTWWQWPLDGSIPDRVHYPPCYVYVDNGNLCVTGIDITPNTTSITLRNGDLFVGVDDGEFSGVLIHERGRRSIKEPYPAPVNVVEDNCQGFIRLDPFAAYAFTGLDHLGSGRGAIFYISYEKETDEWIWRQFAELGSQATAFIYDRSSKTIYVTTNSTGLLSVDEEGNVTQLFTVEGWETLRTNSMVLMDDNLFIGTAMGVARYNTKTQVFTYFPLDYDTYWQEN